MSEKVNFITTNSYKFEVARQFFARLPENEFSVVQYDIETPEVQDDSEERIAEQSAIWVSRQLGELAVASDVGFRIDSLGGFPGPFVKYANNAYPSALDPYLWLPEKMIVTYGGIELLELQSLEISIQNSLIPRFFASRIVSGWSPRNCNRIDDGEQIIEAKISSFDRLISTIRGLVPKFPNGSDDTLGIGFTVDINMLNACSAATGLIRLNNCLQKQLSEPFSPMNPIEYEYNLSIGSLEWYQYA